MSKKSAIFDLLPLVFNRGPFEYYGRILRHIASNTKISSVPNALIFDSLTTLFMQAR